MKKLPLILCSIVCFLLCITPLHAQETFDIASEYAILVNLEDDEILYEKNSDKQLYPASMTKIMSVLTALDHIDDVQKKVTITQGMLDGLSEAGASVAGFRAGEELSVQDLIYGAILPSGADACRALAFEVAGSEEAFAVMMNQKAESLGLKNTHFMNASGLHHDNHYTTAKEMAIILKSAIQNPTIYAAMASENYVTSATSLRPVGVELTSALRKQERNVNLYNGTITGGKTGFTFEGGLCLASFVFNEKGSYLLVSGNAGMDSSYPQHIVDAHTIYEYMLTTYQYQEILPAKHEIANIKVKYNLFNRSIKVQEEQAISALVNQSYDASKIVVNYEGPLIIDAPIEKGQLLGEIQVVYEGEVLKQIPYYAESDIGRNFLLYGFAMFIDFMIAIRYGLLTLLVVFVLFVAYRRYKVLQRRKRRRHSRK